MSRKPTTFEERQRKAEECQRKQSELIDTSVAEQMRQPWPLNSRQLDLIRRTFTIRWNNAVGDKLSQPVTVVPQPAPD